jgi:hypothetical protein
MKILFFHILTILTFGSLFAQTTTSISAGAWNTGGNWNNGVPADGGTATINRHMTLNKHLNINDGNYSVTDAGKITDPAGGTDYNIDVRGTGVFTVSGNVVIGGDLEIRNFGVFTLKGCDTMTVNGDVRFSNFAVVTIESCAVLFINGDLDIRNDNTTQLDGNVVVAGNLTSRNSAVITGTGNLQTNGEVDIRNSSTIFGTTTACSPGPCEYGSGGGLPIVLVDFTADRKSCKYVSLEWTTESEINNDYFTLEYSIDGRNYTHVATIEGSGNTSKVMNYHFNHQVEGLNRTIYYKLSQTDFDGKKEEFDVIALNNSNPNDCRDLFGAHIYPNPGNGSNITIDFTGLIGEKVNVLIRNMSGRILYESAINVSQEVGVSLTDVGELPKGVYFVSLENESKSTTIKYIVTH